MTLILFLVGWAIGWVVAYLILEALDAALDFWSTRHSQVSEPPIKPFTLNALAQFGQVLTAGMAAKGTE